LLLHQQANQLSDKDCSVLFAFLSQIKILESIVLGALAKNGSFGFAKGRLVCRAKPNVPFVRLAVSLFSFLSLCSKNSVVISRYVDFLS